MASDVEILIDIGIKNEDGVKRLTLNFNSLEESTGELNKGIGILDIAIGDFIGGALTGLADLAIEGAQALLEFGDEAIDLAAAAGETASLFEISLGPALAGYNEQVNEIADATGRSAAKFNEAISPILAMSRSMGLAQDDAANFSATIGGLALDLNSFFNSETAFEDIQSALAGSSETLQKYGIDVRETALRQAALEQGLIDTLGPLDQQTRALAILGEIQRQASDAVGDAARTADSAANQARALEDAYFDLQVEIGQKLLPVQEEWTSLQLEFVQDFGPRAVSLAGELTDTFLDLSVVLGNASENTATFLDQLEEVTGVDAGLNFRNFSATAANFATFGLVNGLKEARQELDRIAANQLAPEQALDTINAYYIGLGQIAQAEVLSQQAAQDRIDTLAAEEAQRLINEEIGRVEELVQSYAHLAGAKEEVNLRDIGGGGQLQQIYDEELQRLANIETTNTLLEDQAAARRDREREVLNVIKDQQRELGALFDIGSTAEGANTADLLFQSLQDAGSALGDIVLAAGDAGINPLDVEAATDAALLAQEVENVRLAVDEGNISVSEANEQLSLFQQSLIDNTDNAGDLVLELGEVRDLLNELDGTTTATLEVNVPGLNDLERAVALMSGIASQQQLIGQVGQAEASNIASRQFNANTNIPSTTTEAASRGLQ